MMLKLSEAEILEHIAAGRTFECTADDGAFSLKIDEYSPAICTAIHAGHRLRDSLTDYCALQDSERFYEEDPYTEELIQVMPITLIGNDSRYEYDLNRPIATCIYHKAWGKVVWHKPLPQREKRLSIQRHQRFYRILDALIAAVESRFGACIVFDVHSYNYQRREEVDTPAFNLGTEQIDHDRWSSVIQRLQKNLNGIVLDGRPSRSACNDVFFGRGYLVAHTNSIFENTLALPLEVKKLFMDELSGLPYPLVLNELKEVLKHVLVDITAYFSRRYSRKTRFRPLDVLTSRIDGAIIKLDRSLYQLAKGLDTLLYINPINIEAEKKRFFNRRGNYRPNFHYRPLDIDPYQFREALYRLPVNSIRDPSIQQLYRQVIDGLSGKIDLLVNAGQPQFVYDSLKYYGEPSLDDERNAYFLLHAPSFNIAEEERSVLASDLVERFRAQAINWNMHCKVELSTRLAASAMVSNSKKTIYVRRGVILTETEARALLHHELGVHMATTLNAQLQPLKIFSLGLPGNTMTQEGLAILNEFNSGNLSLTRLQELALRVLAVRDMLTYGDFRHTYSYLLEEHGMSNDGAFRLAVRVHRAGGLTKDYLYLQGVNKALAAQKERDINGLYIGKTGFDYLDVIDEMISRELIQPPRFVPMHPVQPLGGLRILDYLMSAIRPTVSRTTGSSEYSWKDTA